MMTTRRKARFTCFYVLKRYLLASRQRRSPWLVKQKTF
nr:MAG TPA: hypothetical protein [Caudoviricetes sp.]